MMTLKVDSDSIARHGKPGREITVHLGTFDVEGNELVVGDPCRDRNSHESVVLRSVASGPWIAWVMQQRIPPFGCINTGLICTHQDAPVHPGEGSMCEQPLTICVDSGQAGIFDAAHYGDDSVGSGPDPQTTLQQHLDSVRSRYADTISGLPQWYGMCSAVTLDKGVGIIPYGVVCSSGLGDGCYAGTAFENRAGQVVAVGLVFVGVEFAPDLCEVAKENIAIYERKVKREANVEVVESDAAEYQVGEDDSVFFLFNTFGEEAMTEFLTNILRSLDEHPRKLWLIYHNPTCREIVEGLGAFRKNGEYLFSAYGDPFVVYVTK